MPRSSRIVRRIAGVGAALGVAAAAAMLAPAAASAAPAEFAPADQAAFGPGVQIETPVAGGSELCTANFVYSDGSDVYLGTAAHCTAGEGASSGVNGCVEPVMGEGTPVKVRGRDGSVAEATVAYSSWEAMQQKGESDPATCELNDFALLALDPADVGRTSPTVPGFGGPTQLDTDGTTEGEKVFSYQPNQVSAGPNKQGVSHGQDDPRTHVVTTLPQGVPGDSGAGYMDAQGNAFGSLSSLMVPTTSNGAADIAQALDYAERNGGPGSVSLVPGDEPFSPTGLPLTELPTSGQLPTLPLPELVPSPLAG